MNKDGWIIKSHEISSLEYGCYPGARSTDELIKNGIVILDKWQGVTSRKAVEAVKKVLCIKKAGHSGTLDPNVSGVLPVALGNACKVMPALQGLDKEYVGVMHLHKDTKNSELAASIKKIIGRIKQIPPVKSAVARRERERVVHSFHVLEKKGKDVLFRVSCEAGTYVRLICHQIGKETGGAHMAELRRTKVGPYTESQCIKMQELVDAYNEYKKNDSKEIRELITPVEAAVGHVKKIIIKDSAVSAVCHGSPLYSGGICRLENDIVIGSLVAILTLKGELVALGTANMNSNEMAKKKGLAVKTNRVIMEKNVY